MKKLFTFAFCKVDIGWLVRKGRRKGGELAKEGVWKAREGEEVEEGKELIRRDRGRGGPGKE